MRIMSKIKGYDNLDYIDDVVKLLFEKLDEAIDDMENEKVQTIEEVWKEIDEIN